MDSRPCFSRLLNCARYRQKILSLIASLIGIAGALLGFWLRLRWKRLNDKEYQIKRIHAAIDDAIASGNVDDINRLLADGIRMRDTEAESRSDSGKQGSGPDAGK